MHAQSPLGCMYNMIGKQMCVGDHKVCATPPYIHMMQASLSICMYMYVWVMNELGGVGSMVVWVSCVSVGNFGELGESGSLREQGECGWSG